MTGDDELVSVRSDRVRALAKLATRRGRAQAQKFLVEGPQAVVELVRHRPDLLDEVYVTRDAWAKHPRLGEALAEVAAAPRWASEAVIHAIADTVTPQGVVAVAHVPADPGDDALKASTLVVILADVRDPGNAGAVIRAADAAGANAVILAGDSVDPFSPKVVRSTTGSIFHLPIVRCASTADAIALARAARLTVCATDVSGTDIDRSGFDLSAPTAWLFGNEAHGLTDADRAACDAVVRLPILGRAESLNLATAASVFVYLSAFAQRAHGDAGDSERR